jgi:hypothetical protein
MPEPAPLPPSENVEGSIASGGYAIAVHPQGALVSRQATLRVRPRATLLGPPRPQRGFINRSVELGKLENWIFASEVVLVHGPDGMGKSALLKQAANTPSARTMSGVILLENVDHDGQALGLEDIVQRLFDTLFESEPPLKVDTNLARDYLANTRPLLLMDEVSLSPAIQRILPDLFPQGAILISADLATSGDFHRLSVGALPREEAINLLSARMSTTLSVSNYAKLNALCAILGDIPLAIVLIGNLMRVHQILPDAALQGLEALPALGPNPVSATIDRAFAFAFDKLTPEERKIICVAASTPGVSMSPDWFSAALGGIPVSAFIEDLTSLGFLASDNGRLRLSPGFLAPARHAALRLIDENTLLTGLLDFLTTTLRKNPRDWPFFDAELGNLYGALTRAMRARRWADVIALGRALDPYLCLHGLWDSWNSVLGSVLDAARQSNDPATQAWALHQQGTRFIGLGDPAQAITLLKQALEIRKRLGDAAALAYTQHNLSLLAPTLPKGTTGELSK